MTLLLYSECHLVFLSSSRYRQCRCSVTLYHIDKRLRNAVLLATGIYGDVARKKRLVIPDVELRQVMLNMPNRNIVDVRSC